MSVSTLKLAVFPVSLEDNCKKFSLLILRVKQTIEMYKLEFETEKWQLHLV